MNWQKQRRDDIKPHRKPDSDRADKLGTVLEKLMAGRISSQHKRFEPVAQLWEQLLPEELSRHCKIIDLQHGQLKVRVDSPVYANELRWCSADILNQLQQQCWRAKIDKIKIVVG